MENHPDVEPIVIPPLVHAVPATPAFAGENGPAFAEAPSHFESYVKAVADAAAAWSTDDLREVISFLHRVYNAANYFGELCPAEAAQLQTVLCRLTAVPEPPVRDETAIGRTAAEEHEKLMKAYKADVAKRDRHLRRLLQVNGEVISNVVALPAVLLALRGLARRLPPSDIWRLRTLYRHHQALEHEGHDVFVGIAECIDALRDTDDIPTLIELSFAQNAFRQEEIAATSAFKAVRNSGLQLEESAMFGVRTRWQSFKTVQSLLLARSSGAPEPLGAAELARTLPVAVESEKDGHDLYDRPREDTTVPALEEPPLLLRDHAIILALGHNINNSNPAFGLTKHQIQTYAERLLTDKADPVYAIRAMELLLKARVEFQRNRVAQRSFLQLQGFVEQFPAASAATLRPTWYRTDPRYAFLVAWPPIWALKREYAFECSELTMWRTALQVYEEAEDWPKIIECCSKLDRRRKAETLARERLEQDPENPVLWIALGEATREESYLWKAWELSGHRMAGPMRSLARLALQREQWEKVVEYFDLAVAINPIFGGDWFSLGFASLKLGRLETSARAFTRVCQMTPDNAFAWTNLGNILVKLGRERAAFCAMSQALRVDRTNWRMWGNYWAVGTRLLEVLEATSALAAALQYAERRFVYEADVLVDFTDMVMRYLNGELKLRDNVRDDGSSAFTAVQLGGSEEEQQQQQGETALASAKTEAAAAEDEGEEECCDIEPFGAISDEDDENDIVAAAVERRKNDAAAEEAKARDRFVKRLRDVLEQFISLFVDDPDLYACCARVFGKLDGDAAEFKYRLKEVREAKSNMWERSEDKFKRVLAATTALANVAERLRTAEAKRQALDAAENNVRTASGYLDSLPVYAEAEQLRLRVSRFSC